jgi:cell division protein FtsL
MAAYHYQRRVEHRPGEVRPPAVRPRPRAPSPELARRWRAFVALAVIPALLMLGGIYLNTVANDLSSRVAELRQQVEQVELQNREMEARASELSRPERIMDRARGMGLREPGAESVKVYGSDGMSTEEDRTEYRENRRRERSQ